MYSSIALRSGMDSGYSTLREFVSRQQIDSTVPWPMRWKLGECLLSEDNQESHIIRWDRGRYTGLGALNPRGGDLDSR